MAHEITHAMINDKYGPFKSKTIGFWKIEGYCDYISNESSFNIELGSSAITSEEMINNSSFDYFKSRIMIDYLMDLKEYTYDEIVKRDFDKDQLEKEIKQSLNKIDLYD